LIGFDVLLDAAAAVGDARAMSSWSAFAASAPDLAAEVRTRLDAHTHKTLATVRRDGAPRISGTETMLVDGDLWIGSMPAARKAHDLLRDPRYALHSGSDDPPGWTGDAKVAGHAEEITDPDRVEAIVQGKAPPGPMHLFRLDIEEASTVVLDDTGDGIVVRWWTPEGGVRTVERG
jgi:hypothetical protein